MGQCYTFIWKYLQTMISLKDVVKVALKWWANAEMGAPFGQIVKKHLTKVKCKGLSCSNDLCTILHSYRTLTSQFIDCALCIFVYDDTISLFEVWREQQERAYFKLGNLLSTEIQLNSLPNLKYPSPFVPAMLTIG